MSKQSFNRAELVRIANLVRPALASQPYIKALVHICFVDGAALAYNDVTAIRVNAPDALGGLDVLVPGDQLIKALGGLGADAVSFTLLDDGGLVMKSGRSTIKLPTLEAGKFPLDWPRGDADEVEITDDILRGIERCLLSVGKDPKRPAQMGVTLDITDGAFAALYSTDNVTISRYETVDTIELPGDAPVILPKFFCEQLVALARTYPELPRVLLLRDGSLTAEFGEEAALFTRVPVDMQPMDFPTVFGKFCPAEFIDKRLFPIPDGLDGALGRALLMAVGEAEPVTTVTPDGMAGTIVLESGGNDGKSTDELEVESSSDLGFGAVRIDPAKVARGAKATALMGINERVTVLASADRAFVHIIAHVA